MLMLVRLSYVGQAGSCMASTVLKKETKKERMCDYGRLDCNVSSRLDSCSRMIGS